jgi:hypothetical protein
MYQLGFARSRGKATLVLVQEEQMLPGFPVDERDFFRFSWGEVGTRTFRKRLCEAINAIKDRTNPYHIVDQVYFPHIWVSPQYNWLSGPDFFQGFVSISTTSHFATKLLQRIIHAQVDPMLRLIDEIITIERFSSENSDVKAYLVKRKNECRETWEQYISAYITQYKDAIDTMRHLLDEILIDTFSGMKKYLSPEYSDVLAKCQQLAHDLNQSLEQYTTHQQAAQDFVTQEIITILANSEHTSTLSGMLANLSSSGKKIMIKAVALNYNLLKLTAETSC